MMQLLIDCRLSKIALQMYEEYTLENDHISHVLAMKAYINCKNIDMAAEIVKQKILKDWSDVQHLPIKTSTTLLEFYGVHCSDIASSKAVFNEIQNRNEVTIAVFMKALIFNRLYDQALQLYEEYKQFNDNILHLLAIKACVNSGNIEYGKEIIQSRIMLNENASIELLHTLIDFYGVHCLDITNAGKLFNRIPFEQRNVITINTMMKALTINGNSEQALLLYENYEHLINNISHVLAIKACISNSNIEYGKNIIQSKIFYERDNNLSIELLNTLIDFYGIHCLDINTAQSIFNTIPVRKRDAITIRIMTKSLANNGKIEQALQLYEEYQHLNDNISHLVIIKACMGSGDIEYARNIITSKVNFKLKNIPSLNIELLNTLIDFYGVHCSDINYATNIFNGIPSANKTSVTINAMMKVLAFDGKIKQALQLYEDNARLNNNASHILAIKACIMEDNIERAKDIIQSKINYKNENISNLSIELLNTLIDFYGVHCLDIHTAQFIFDAIPDSRKNAATIRILMKAFKFNDKCEQALQLYKDYEQFKDSKSHVMAIKTCISINDIQRAKDIIQSKIMFNLENVNNFSIELLNTLVYFYGVNCSDFKYSSMIFNEIELPKRDAVTVNSMMKVLIFNEKYNQALQLYDDYEHLNNSISHVLAIKACIGNGDIKCAKNIIQSKIHFADENINNHSIELLNTLIDFYGVHCLDITYAKKLFNKIEAKDMNAVCVNSMMKALTFNGQSDKSLQLYAQYEQFSNSISHVLAIKACISSGKIEYAKNIIQDKINFEEEQNLSIELLSTLIDFYGVHCLDIKSAEKIFNAIPIKKRNLITINTMIKVLTLNGKIEQALKLYEGNEMFNDNVSHVLALKACMSSSNLLYGKDLIRSKILFKDENINDLSIELLTTLVDFYGDYCLDIKSAENVFNSVPIAKTNVVMVNAMMNAYRINDLNTDCLQLFETLDDDVHINADCVSFTIALQACGEGKILHSGRRIHQLMTDAIFKDLLVQTSLIIMYGKCGQLDVCSEIFASIKANEFEKYCTEIELFHAMMNSCAKNGEISQLMEVWNAMKNETSLVSNAKTYSIIFTAFSHAGEVERARVVFNSIGSDDVKSDEYARSSYVDVLARGGCLDEALKSILQYEQNIKSSTKSYYYPMWMSLLGGCRKIKDNEMSLIVYNHMQERFEKSSTIMANASVLAANTIASNT